VTVRLCRRLLPLLLLVFAVANAQAARAEPGGELERILVLLGFDAMAVTAPLNARVWASALAQQHRLSEVRQQQLAGHLRAWPDAAAIRGALLRRVAPLCPAEQLNTALQRLEQGGLASIQVALALDAGTHITASGDYASTPRADIDALLEAAGTVEQLIVINSAHEQALRRLLQEVWGIEGVDYGAADEHVRSAGLAAQRTALQQLARNHFQQALRYTGAEQIRKATAALQDESVRCVLDNATEQLALTLRDFVQSP
jgi:hypothetical protein